MGVNDDVLTYQNPSLSLWTCGEENVGVETSICRDVRT